METKKKLFRFITDKAGINRPILFASINKVFSIIASPITIYLVVNYFSPVTQGYYYTFYSLAALTVFLELGLAQVIQQFASHEWAFLDMTKEGYIIGNNASISKLSFLSKKVFQWYLFSGILAFIFLSIGGYYFFSSSSDQNGIWQLPWIFQSLLSGLNLIILPAWALLDGCNQMRFTFPFKFLSTAISSIFLWIFISKGLGLFSIPLTSTLTFLLGLIFLLYRYKNFFITLFSTKVTDFIDWKYEIWPMQWRIGLSWLSQYIVFSYATPMVFKLLGPIEAGKVGITWSAMNGILLLSHNWVSVRAPEFAILIAKRNFTNLDKLFKKSFILSFFISIFASSSFILLIKIFNLYNIPFSNRFLSPEHTMIYVFSIPFTLSLFNLSVYLRSHKREPLMVVTVLLGLLIIISTIILGKKLAIVGIGLGFTISTFICLIPAIIIFLRKRNEWHKV